MIELPAAAVLGSAEQFTRAPQPTRVSDKGAAHLAHHGYEHRAWAAEQWAAEQGRADHASLGVNEQLFGDV
jgi:hypothetical protein